MDEKLELDRLLKHFKANGMDAGRLAERIQEKRHVLYDLARPDGRIKAGEKAFSRVLGKLRDLERYPLSIDERLEAMKISNDEKLEEIKILLLRLLENQSTH